MSKLMDYNFPDNLQYIFLEPNSFFWIKKAQIDNQREDLVLELGFPEIITKNLVKGQLKFGFRSEKLRLREKKVFLRMLTRNKLFEFLSPFNCDWIINPNLKNNDFRFLDHPNEEFIIKCFNFEDKGNLELLLKNKFELEQIISRLEEKGMFNDCSSCPDLFQGSITRRKDSSN